MDDDEDGNVIQSKGPFCIKKRVLPVHELAIMANKAHNPSHAPNMDVRSCELGICVVPRSGSASKNRIVLAIDQMPLGSPEIRLSGR